MHLREGGQGVPCIPSTVYPTASTTAAPIRHYYPTREQLLRPTLPITSTVTSAAGLPPFYLGAASPPPQPVEELELG